MPCRTLAAIRHHEAIDRKCNTVPVAESFFSRWARLKGANTTDISVRQSGSPPGEAIASRAACPPRNIGQDLAGLVRSEISEKSRLAGLRCLWSENAALYAPDGLDVYCENFRQVYVHLIEGATTFVSDHTVAPPRRSSDVGCPQVKQTSIASSPMAAEAKLEHDQGKGVVSENAETHR